MKFLTKMCDDRMHDIYQCLPITLIVESKSLNMSCKSQEDLVPAFHSSVYSYFALQLCWTSACPLKMTLLLQRTLRTLFSFSQSTFFSAQPLSSHLLLGTRALFMSQQVYSSYRFFFLWRALWISPQYIRYPSPLYPDYPVLTFHCYFLIYNLPFSLYLVLTGL